MPPAPLDAELILTTTEDVLRRYGPAKATVVDVARVLGVSHAAVYRHFPSKVALREAVTRRWLQRTSVTLQEIAGSSSAPPARLRAWLTAMFEAKRARATDDPELFATFRVLAADHSDVTGEHVRDLVAQLTAIISAGVADGSFAVASPAVAARAVFDATMAFHNPAHAVDWNTPGIEDNFFAVRDLVIAGLRPC